MSPPDLRITIDEIVLDGVAVTDVEAFRAELEGMLARLAAGHRGGYPAGVAAELRGRPVVVPAHTAGTGLGAQVARSVWDSIVPATFPFGGGPGGGGEP